MTHEDFARQFVLLEAERREVSKKIEEITLDYIQTCQFKVGEKVLLTRGGCADDMAFVKSISLPYNVTNSGFRISLLACKKDGTVGKNSVNLYGWEIKKIAS